MSYFKFFILGITLILMVSGGVCAQSSVSAMNEKTTADAAAELLNSGKTNTVDSKSLVTNGIETESMVPDPNRINSRDHEVTFLCQAGYMSRFEISYDRNGKKILLPPMTCP